MSRAIERRFEVGDDSVEVFGARKITAPAPVRLPWRICAFIDGAQRMTDLSPALNLREVECRRLISDDVGAAIARADLQETVGVICLESLAVFEDDLP